MREYTDIELDRIASQLKDDVNEFCLKLYAEDDQRKHLGASIIGHDCDRYLYNTFRWVKKPEFDGRMHRLFNRGHNTEDRFATWLKGAGGDVWAVDPETQKQYRVSGVEEHFGGSLDSEGLLRKYLGEEIILFEFKTHNSKSFLNLIKKRVRMAKPQHYAQMCSYGRKRQRRFGLYCAINKNDDDLYFELVRLDYGIGEMFEKRAVDIITANPENPPRKIGMNPAFHECSYCDFKDICHGEEPIGVNCRSCRFSRPIENGKWFCTGYQQAIPDDFIPKGCPHHQPIPR